MSLGLDQQKVNRQRTAIEQDHHVDEQAERAIPGIFSLRGRISSLDSLCFVSSSGCESMDTSSDRR
jgi:hypothetical protein